MTINNKIISNVDFLKKKNFLKKKIGLCHGAFDVLHVGHLKHFQEAKKYCDILIVSITSEKFIKKGPLQPFFGDSDRSYFLSKIDLVDYIYVSKSYTGLDSLNKFKPNFYIKGIDYLNKRNDSKLDKEILFCKKNNISVVYTASEKFSSSKILNSKFNVLDKDQHQFLKKIKTKYSINKLISIFDEISKKTFAISGEPIIDKYTFVDVIGTATKSPIITSNKQFDEIHDGGSLFVLKVLSEFVKKILFISPVPNNQIDVSVKKYNSNILIKGHNIGFITPEKKRYLTTNRNRYLYQVNKINNFVPKKNFKFFLEDLRNIQNKYPLLYTDFGLGLINKRQKQKIDNGALFLNVQSNSNNFGFNLFSQYKKKTKYLSINQRELELNYSEKLLNFNEIINLCKNICFFPASVTLGMNGSVFVNKNKKIYYCPNFFKDPKDTVGCGDAYFAITSLLVNSGYNDEVVPFIGNLYAGLHSLNFGNKTIPTKTELLTVLNYFYNF